MKKLEDIMNLSDSELEAIADDARIEVPEDLDASIRSSLEAGRQRKSRKPLFSIVGGICSVAAALAACLLVLNRPGNDLYAEPEDSFSDPAEAYAYLQNALGRIGTSVHDNLESPAMENGIRMTKELFNESR